MPPLQQIVLYARRNGRLTTSPAGGSFTLEDDRCVLLWPFATAGDVEAKTRLCVVQSRFPLIEPWIDALDALFNIES